MPTVCRIFTTFSRQVAATGPQRPLSIVLLPQARFGQLLDVVHHAVQVPLRVDFGVASVVKASQTLVVPDIGKHRLHGADALAVEAPAAW